MPSKKHSRIPSSGLSDHPRSSTSVAKIVHPSHFPTQKPSGVPTFPLLEFEAINILTFLVVAQVITLVLVHHFL